MKMDLWTLLNVPLENLLNLISAFKNFCSKNNKDYASLLNTYSIANLGDQTFWQELRLSFGTDINQPVIIVPANAHYGWSKASHIFGIGKKQCLEVQMNPDLTMSIEHLERLLHECTINRNPIIQLVSVLGSTEFGTFDFLPDIVKIKESCSIYFPVHIDAAYGGYFKTMFEPGQQYADIAIRAKKEHSKLYTIMSEISHTDSITVDPHKLGSTPYGAGMFITKHGFSKDFVAEDAAYCLSEERKSESEFPLGKYIIEGSKPGASAASVYFSNKMIPLNSDGYGGLIWDFCQVTKTFYQLMLQANLQVDSFSDRFEFCFITPPQSNILCFYVRPKKIRDIKLVNMFNKSIIYHFFPRETDHIQNFKFIISKTKLYFSKFSDSSRSSITPNLQQNEDYVLLARLVFMNRWLSHENSSGKNYMLDFIDEIKKICIANISKVEQL